MKTYDIEPGMELDLRNRFTCHSPCGDQNERYVALRNAAHGLAITICSLTPKSREQALALTHLETAIFWANAAIARHEVPETPELIPLPARHESYPAA